MAQPIKITPAVRELIELARTSLASLPPHQTDPSLRPVVVLARESRRRPVTLLRYHSEPADSTVSVDGYDTAMIVAD